MLSPQEFCILVVASSAGIQVTVYLAGALGVAFQAWQRTITKERQMAVLLTAKQLVQQAIEPLPQLSAPTQLGQLPPPRPELGNPSSAGVSARVMLLERPAKHYPQGICTCEQCHLRYGPCNNESCKVCDRRLWQQDKDNPYASDKPMHLRCI